MDGVAYRALSYALWESVSNAKNSQIIALGVCLHTSILNGPY